MLYEKLLLEFLQLCVDV